MQEALPRQTFEAGEEHGERPPYVEGQSVTLYYRRKSGSVLERDGVISSIYHPSYRGAACKIHVKYQSKVRWGGTKSVTLLWRPGNDPGNNTYAYNGPYWIGEEPEK